MSKPITSVNKFTISMKWVVFGLLLVCMLYAVNGAQYTICSSGCDFNNITLALENVTNTSNTLRINSSGTYTITNITTFQINDSLTMGALIIDSDNVLLDCGNAEIEGEQVGYGIYVNASNVTLNYCKVNQYIIGVYYEGSDSNNIHNLSAVACDYGIRLENTNTTQITDPTIQVSSVVGIHFNSAKNNTIINAVVSASTSDITSAGTGTYNYIYNSSFSKSKLTFTENSMLYNFWYVKIHINDTSGNNVNNSVVNISDNTGTLTYSLTTNASGYTNEKNITEYLANSTGFFYYTNYTLYAYNATYFANRSVNISSSSTISVPFDLTAPVVSSLVNTTTNETATVTFSTDDKANVTLKWGNASSNLNETATNASFLTSHSYSLNGLSANTIYYYNITVCNENSFCSENGLQFYNQYYNTFVLYVNSVCK